MALTSATATALVSTIDDVAGEIGGDACQIICEAKALICSNPSLTQQCADITALAQQYNCSCPGDES